MTGWLLWVLHWWFLADLAALVIFMPLIIAAPDLPWHD